MGTNDILEAKYELCITDSIFVLLQCIMKIGHNYEAIFPLIDLMRLMIRNYSVNVLLCGKLNVF